jgi:hypothetical protein
VSKTEYDVCLVLASPSATLAAMSDVLGVQPSDGSHNRGDPHLLRSRGQWQETVWKRCSECGRGAPLEQHLRQVFDGLPAVRVAECRQMIGDLQTYVSIGVFSDAQIPTAHLIPACVTLCAEYGAGIQVAFYMPDMT